MTIESYSISSPSPVSNNYDNTWVITRAGNTALQAYFSSINTESGYDFVKVYNGSGTSGTLLSSWSGTQSGVWSAASTSDTITIQLITDGSVQSTGFTVTQIQYISSGGGGGGGSDDYGSTTSSYGSLNNSGSGTKSGSIESAGDKDWFRFVPTYSGTATFTSSSSTSLDTYGTVYDSSGSTALASNDDGAGGGQFSISMQVTAGTVYFLEVRAYSASATGSYTVSYTLPTGPTDDYGSTTSSYGTIPSTGSGSISGSLEVSGDRDWFRLVPTYSGAATFSSSSNPSFDTYGTLYASDGSTVIAQNDDGAGNSQFLISTSLVGGSVYYLEMRAYNNTSTGSYSISYSMPASPTLISSISLSPSSATISVGNTQTLTPTISPSNASNQTLTWTSSNTSIATVSSGGIVTGVAAGSTTITATAQDGSGKTATSSITISAYKINTPYDKKQTIATIPVQAQFSAGSYNYLGFSTTSSTASSTIGNALAGFEFPTSGSDPATANVKVSGLTPGSTTTLYYVYQTTGGIWTQTGLSISITTDGYISTNSTGTTTSSQTVISTADDRWFTFQPTYSGNANFYSTGPTVDTKGYLYNSSMTLLSSEDDDPIRGLNFDFQYAVTAGSLYYFKVTNFTGSGTYALNISAPAQFNPPGSPGSVTFDSITSSSFTANWSAPTSGGTPTEYRYQYKLSTDAWPTQDAAGTYTSTTNLYANISSLLSDTSYDFRVWARNADGSSSTVSNSTSTLFAATATIDSVSSGTVYYTMNLSKTFTTANYIEIGFSTTSIPYGSTTTPSGKITSSVLSAQSYYVPPSSTITGLSLATAYTLYGYARVANGTYYPVGSAVTFTTGPSIADIPERTDTTLTLNWGFISGATYDLTYVTGSNPTTITGITGTSRNLTGLSPNSLYTFTIAPKATGVTYPSASSSGSTKPSAPQLAVASSSPTNITLSITGTTGLVTTIFIYYYNGTSWVQYPTSIYPDSKTITGSGNVSFSITNSKVLYRFYATTINSAVSLTSSVTDFKVKTDFVWDSTISSGGAYNITADEWNRFNAIVSDLRAYKGLSTFSYTSVSSQGTFTASIFNATRIAVGGLYSTGLSNVSSGDPVYASYFSTLANSLNSVTI